MGVKELTIFNDRLRYSLSLPEKVLLVIYNRDNDVIWKYIMQSGKTEGKTFNKRESYKRVKRKIDG